MTHGLPKGRGVMPALCVGRDCSDGCLAVTDAEIEAHVIKDGDVMHFLFS